MKKRGGKKSYESLKKSSIVAKARKRGIKLTKKDGRPKTKAQLIRKLRK